MVNNNKLKTSRIFAGCATKALNEHNDLTSSHYLNIKHANRSDTPDMKPIKCIKQLFCGNDFNYNMTRNTCILDVAENSYAYSQSRLHSDIQYSLYFSDRKIE